MADMLMKTTSSLFTIRVDECVCLVDTAHTDEGKEVYTLKLTYPCGAIKHLYAYEPAEGLVEINQKTGAIIPGSNVTEAFLSLDLSDVQKVREFINRYGCFVNIPDNEKYHSISFSDLYTILRRFQLVVGLMSELGKSEHDYNKIANAVLRLHFGRSHRIEMPGTGDFIESCNHPITAYWYDKDITKYTHYIDPQYADIPSYVLDSVVDSYSKDDAFIGTSVTYFEPEHFNFAFEQYMSASDLEKDPWALAMQRLRAFYSCAYPFEENAKLLIHFLANLVMKEENILDWSNGAFAISPEWDFNTHEIFTDRHKEVILQLARSTIKEEFDKALEQVHPTYNAEEMTPGWVIPNLYTALYFSIFYTNPKYEMFRHCANPGCNMVFKVRTSNSRKLYCSLSCQNAAAQARHRTKLKLQ